MSTITVGGTAKTALFPLLEITSDADDDVLLLSLPALLVKRQPAGPPAGGSGGAIYNDSNFFTLTLCGTKIEHKLANEGGGAIFCVSNDRSGSMVIQQSYLADNPSYGFETAGYTGIFFLGDVAPLVSDSTIEQ